MILFWAQINLIFCSIYLSVNKNRMIATTTVTCSLHTSERSWRFFRSLSFNLKRRLDAPVSELKVQLRWKQCEVLRRFCKIVDFELFLSKDRSILGSQLRRWPDCRDQWLSFAKEYKISTAVTSYYVCMCVCVCVCAVHRPTWQDTTDTIRCALVCTCKKKNNRRCADDTHH